MYGNEEDYATDITVATLIISVITLPLVLFFHFNAMTIGLKHS